MPVAFVSWAFLDEEAEERVSKGQMRLRPDEWKRGDKVWLIDVVSPFGGSDAILSSIKEQIFPEQTVHYFQIDPEHGKPVVKTV